MCPSHLTSWRDKCIKINSNSYKSWSDSQSDCVSEGGSLIEFNSTVQQAYTDTEVYQLLQQYRVTKIWVGARKQKSWYWSDDGTTNSGKLHHFLVIWKKLFVVNNMHEKSFTWYTLSSVMSMGGRKRKKMLI